jgi:type I restriction enzyme S subunit
MSDVPEGYRMSEVGVIPEEWEVKNVGEFAYATAGGTPSTLVPEYWNGNIRWMNSGELNLKKIFNVEGRITETGLKNSSTKIVPQKCVLIGLAGQGKTRGTAAINYVELSTNQSIAAIFPNDSFVPEYLFYIIDSRYNELRNLSTGDGGRGGLNLRIIKGIPVPLPTKEEQQAIASALSDVDALITALEQLISKKRNIKQGAMQQLLTGKKRLPGFGGECEVKKLGKLLEYEQPTNYIVKDTEYNNNNDTPVLTAGKTFILGYTNEKTGIFRDLPVIIFDDFTTANKYVTYPFKVKSSAMKILKPKNENTNLRFVFEKIQLIIFHLGDHKRYWISEYQNLEIELPSLPEQEAIAQILSDMDAEIEALEQKRDKYKAIKQGMMQELLTGKTRLV